MGDVGPSEDGKEVLLYQYRPGVIGISIVRWARLAARWCVDPPRDGDRVQARVRRAPDPGLR